MDEKKSYSAAVEYLLKDERVSAQLLQEKQQKAQQEFDDWTKGLEIEKNGSLKNTLVISTAADAYADALPTPSKTAAANEISLFLFISDFLRIFYYCPKFFSQVPIIRIEKLSLTSTAVDSPRR
ncbi:MAG: hypothetical protein LIO76_06110 [Clostridiales bacterium]|nr:hypothetical protein [Clostridiales bacterium]